MNRHHDLFGVYLPRDSVLHRLPAGAKILGLTGLVIVSFLFPTLPVAAGLTVLCALALLAARIPWRLALWPGWFVLGLAAMIVAYHGVAGRWGDAGLAACNLLTAVYGGRLVVFTTPIPAVVDAISAGLRPLRWIGLDPDRVALAIGLMLRSIPMLFALFDDVGDAARARGLERNFAARLTPVVVRAVAYAQTTGDALAARGLGERAARH